MKQIRQRLDSKSEIITKPEGGMPDPKARAEIDWMIDKMFKALDDGTIEDPEMPLRHFFSEGVYAREIFIPKGTLVIGKIHKTSHVNIISKGKVTVKTQFLTADYEAPYTFISPIGTQRVVYAHEDTIWTTIHATEETDPGKIEDDIIAKSYDELPDLYGPARITA